MPLAEYKCECGKTCEKLVPRMSDAPSEQSCECGGSMKRMIGRTSFVLNGGGWASSGYAKTN